jgi:hypothetical protein
MFRTYHATRIQLQSILTARCASFARQRSYSYASSQELTHRTRQNGLRFWKGVA